MNLAMTAGDYTPRLRVDLQTPCQVIIAGVGHISNAPEPRKFRLHGRNTVQKQKLQPESAEPSRMRWINLFPLPKIQIGNVLFERCYDSVFSRYSRA